MAKKYKSVIPKRVIGMKVPKRLRKFAATPFGGALLAETMVLAAGSVAGRRDLRFTAGRIGDEAGQAGAAGVSFVTHVARAALVPFVAAAHSIMDKAETYRAEHKGALDDSDRLDPGAERFPQDSKPSRMSARDEPVDAAL